MKHLEDSEQAAVIEWSKYIRIPDSGERLFDYLIAVPNGGNRNAREAARLKNQGVKPGVSDLFLAYPVFPLHGMWIEMKKRLEDFDSPSRARGAITDSQKEWTARMTAAGYSACVCYGAKDALAAIKNYIGVRHEN